MISRLAFTQRFSYFKALLWTFAALTVLFLMAPFVFVGITAFASDRFVRFPPTSFTFEWFGKIDSRFIDATIMSLTLAVVVTALSLILGVMASLAITRGRSKLTSALNSFLRSPLQVPGVVIGVALLQYYGLIASLTGVEFFGTYFGLLIAHLTIVTPYVISSCVSGLDGSVRSVEDAAHSLGASQWTTFWKVILPGMKSALWTGGFFAFLISFDEVPASLFLSVTNNTTLPVEMFFEAEFHPTPSLYAVSAIVTISTATLLIIFDRTIGIRSTIRSR